MSSETDALRHAAQRVQALAAALPARCIETHISWVLLTDAHAYKLKKPLRLSFVDYRSLEARHLFCQEELRLNRRLAPTLYQRVVPITAGDAGPVLDGAGRVLDWAVQMQRFDDDALFSARLAAGTLDAADVDALAALLARFQAMAPPLAPDAPAASDGGAPARRRAVALAALDGAGCDTATHARLAAWLHAEAAALAPLWAQRRADGHVREGHGDLHLDNLVRLPQGVAAFDGIEFDPALRWIDVIDDLAFAVMDFDAHGRHDLAFRLFNGWLDHTGDHAGLPLLRFAVVYRALVRAQVARLRGDAARSTRYQAAALRWTQRPPLSLTLMHGLPGSGKTHVSQRLAQQASAVRIRSDVERKRLAGLDMLADSRALGLDLYTPQATQATYRRLFELASLALAAGYPVILDAAFLKRDERDAAAAVARAAGVPRVIVPCTAPLAQLHARLAARRGDASEADSAVLQRLAAQAAPLDPDELADARAPDDNPA